MTDAAIDAIFDQLDRDRHMAGYRLEERASPFFKLFLPEVMNVKEPIIPELPYAKHAQANSSPKVDFFAISKEGDSAYLIELKTDLESLDSGQIKNLKEVSGSTVGEILAKVGEIASAPTDSRVRQKYEHIMDALTTLAPVSVDAALPKITYILPRPPKARSSNIDLIEKHAEIIYFKQFASVLEEVQGDLATLAKRFAKSLRCWAKVDAGKAKPGTPCP